jgi:hypothetical protein
MNGICSAAVAFCEPICLNWPPSSVAAFCAPVAAASKYGLLIAFGMKTMLRSPAAADGAVEPPALGGRGLGRRARGSRCRY